MLAWERPTQTKNLLDYVTDYYTNIFFFIKCLPPVQVLSVGSSASMPQPQECSGRLQATCLDTSCTAHTPRMTTIMSGMST